jgi:hypothetical protein
MGLPAGCKIVSHYIRSQLESDPSLVIAKVDVKNAFNEIDPAAILAVVLANLPQVLPFADLLLAQSSMQTIFKDFRAVITNVYKMDKGVPQGGSMSSALFNMGQSTSIRRAALFLLQLRQQVIMPSMASVNTIPQLSTTLHKRLTFIPCNLGLQIGVTPVGSLNYMVESVNKTVDAIFSELQQWDEWRTDYICNDSPV